MAEGLFLLSPRPWVGSSLRCGRRIPLRSGKVDVCGAAASWERRRRSGCCYMYSDGGCRRSDNESVNVQFSALTLYELLGISRQVGLQEIKTAYREMARRYHPDMNPPSRREECTKMFLQVQEAYEVLADPDLRAKYDYKLRNPLSGQALTSGFPFKGRKRGQTPAFDAEVNSKQAWRSQWEAQIDGLKRNSEGKKAGSWAQRMQEKRREEEQREKEEREGPE